MAYAQCCQFLAVSILSAGHAELTERSQGENHSIDIGDTELWI